MPITLHHIPVHDCQAQAKELEKLRIVLREVLASFSFTTHPGQECRQSGHVPVATVARWHEALQ